MIKDQVELIVDELHLFSLIHFLSNLINNFFFLKEVKLLKHTEHIKNLDKTDVRFDKEE